MSEINENGPVDQADSNTERRLELATSEAGASAGSVSIRGLPIFQLLGKTIAEINVMDETHHGLTRRFDDRDSGGEVHAGSSRCFGILCTDGTHVEW